MRTRHLALVVTICGTLGFTTPALASDPQAGEPIPGRYIVMVEQGHDADDVVRGRNQQVFDSLNGFAASLDAAQVRALRRSARVAIVEQDRVVEASATQWIPSDPWGLDRIDQPGLPLSRSFTYNAAASNVTAYVIDTGISTSNGDFGGRARNVYDAFGGTGEDCNGHGTHVAGTIGGTTWGVAKGVNLRGVRVLNCSGSGSTSGIVAALNWLRTNAVRPAVANMSLGGGYSSSLNSATNSLANSGVFMAVAAGNENQNACNVSPASASAAYTTAASDRNDRRASFSNWGSCVDAYAPGVAIRSAWLSGGANTISGTSMASPHVAGVAALYKDTIYRNTRRDESSATISSWITGNATPNVIGYNRTGTPNRLLYKAGL